MSEPFTTTLQSLHHKENLLVRHIMLNAYVRLDVANLWLLYCISLFTTKCCLHYLTVSIFQHVAHPPAQLCRWWYRYNNSLCLSVQPSVTLRYCVKKHQIYYIGRNSFTPWQAIILAFSKLNIITNFVRITSLVNGTLNTGGA